MSITLNPATTLPDGFYSFNHEGVLFGYNPLTGCGLRWLTKPSRGDKAFQWRAIQTGTCNKRTCVGINSSTLSWHRLVAQHFLNGGAPIRRELDVEHHKHVDGTAAQDILTNLRIVTRPTPRRSRHLSSLRYSGVSRVHPAGEWQALAADQLTGKAEHLGYFTDERIAAKAYIDYCIQHDLPCTKAIERYQAAPSA